LKGVCSSLHGTMINDYQSRSSDHIRIQHNGLVCCSFLTLSTRRCETMENNIIQSTVPWTVQ
jgi:hypothetical protein